LYLTALAVPQTTLALTDRLAVRIYVTHSGRTITLHTENSHLCQIITTFSTGLTALNGLTAQVQNLAVGTSGTDFAISSVASTHTFNLPTASATNRGALSSAHWSTFNNKANKSSANSGVAISFRTSEVYNSVASPGSGSITDDFSGSIIGVVQKIYHNDTSLVVPGNWIKLGSGTYTPSVLNIIYCEWVSGTRVEYWIVKGS
jgi:hypothetical protein